MKNWKLLNYGLIELYYVEVLVDYTPYDNTRSSVGLQQWVGLVYTLTETIWV